MGDDGGVTDDERRRQRRLAEIFGEVLPETTSDEQSASESGADVARDSDRWYAENRPPHHGG